MFANEMKSGMEVLMTHGREGHIRDNKKGIVRVVEVVVPGKGTDVGSCYVDEIKEVKDFEGNWHHLKLTADHQKKLDNLKGFSW